MIGRALAAIALCAGPAAASPCPLLGLGPDVLTPTGAVLGAGGGVVVATTAVPDGARDAGDASSQPGWRFHVGAAFVTPRRTTVAPGLTVYALPAGATAATLEDAHHMRHADVTVAPGDPKLLDAPSPIRLRYVTEHNHARHVPAITHRVDLVLAAPPPAGALALITYGPDGAARDWLRVDTLDPKSAVLVVSAEHGGCAPDVPGRTLSAAGDALTFAWLDASGRPSARSAAITVKP